MAHYDTAPDEIIDLINETIEEFHPDLVEAQCTVDAILAFDDKGGFPVKAGGYPALACIKITSLKNRVKGMADAEITIDAEAFKNMNALQQKALIDHELYHLIVARDKENNIKTDDANRPKLRMRKHDHQMGWFKAIAIRHKQNSPEVYQANLLWNSDAPIFFAKQVETLTKLGIDQINEQKTDSET
jgi:hypothetical protein